MKSSIKKNNSLVKGETNAFRHTVSMPASLHFNRFLAHYMARIIAVKATIDYVLGMCFGRPH